jgi:hypothetical protein
VVNTIVQAFSKQRVNKDKIAKRDEAHVDTRKRIIQFLTAPASYNDPLRALSADQLSELSDADLVGQALQVLTADNLGGSLRLADGSAIFMRECILEFANNSKTREGSAIKPRLKDWLNDLQDIVEVERYKSMHDDDDIDPDSGDDFAGDGILNFDDDPSPSAKRKVHSTVAGATVGKQQVRNADKRQHQPTNRLGINVALKDKHVIYATTNRSLKANLRLLTEPGVHSKNVPKPVAAAPPVVSGTLLSSSNQIASSTLVPPTSANLAVLVPGVADQQLSNVVEGVHQHNADIASLMSAVPFASGQANGADGGDDDDSSSSYRHASDDGMKDNSSESSSVQSNYDDTYASDAPPADYDVEPLWSDGHHSDLFEILFPAPLVATDNYRRPGTKSMVFQAHCCSHSVMILLPYQRCYRMLMMTKSCHKSFTTKPLKSARACCRSIGTFCIASKH